MPRKGSLGRLAAAGAALALLLTVALAAGCSDLGAPPSSGSQPPAGQPSPSTDPQAGTPPGTDQADTRVVRVYFSKGLDATGRPLVAPVERTVSKETGPLSAALTELLKGPTEQERSAGFSSWFSDKTAGMLNAVNLKEDGLAVVDFKNFSRIIPNASTSTGSEELLSSLGWTIAQFPTVKKIEYRFDGNPAPFYEWLQIGRTTYFDAARYR